MTSFGNPEEGVEAEAIGRSAREHPSVVRLHSGPFGMIATPLPGRTVVGVRTAGPGDSVEVAMVVRLDRPLPELVAEIRDRIRTVAGDVPVDLTVADIVTDAEISAAGAQENS